MSAVTGQYRYNFKTDLDWLSHCLKCLDEQGFVVLEDAVDKGLIERGAEQLPSAREQVSSTYGQARLVEGNELPYVRLPMNFNRVFIEFLEIDSVVKLVESFISPEAILRNQICQTLLPNLDNEPDKRVYHFYHQNFNQLSFIPGVFLDNVIPFQDMTQENGAILLFSGSHKWKHVPSPEELEKKSMDAVKVTLKAGSILFVDGMTWHREELNYSNQNLEVMVHQFVPRVIKQHIDYPRAISQELCGTLSARTKRLLGYESRVPANLDEYYRPLTDLAYKTSLRG